MLLRKQKNVRTVDIKGLVGVSSDITIYDADDTPPECAAALASPSTFVTPQNVTDAESIQSCINGSSLVASPTIDICTGGIPLQFPTHSLVYVASKLWGFGVKCGVAKGNELVQLPAKITAYPSNGMLRTPKKNASGTGSYFDWNTAVVKGGRVRDAAKSDVIITAVNGSGDKPVNLLSYPHGQHQPAWLMYPETILTDNSHGRMGSFLNTSLNHDRIVKKTKTFEVSAFAPPHSSQWFEANYFYVPDGFTVRGTSGDTGSVTTERGNMMLDLGAEGGGTSWTIHSHEQSVPVIDVQSNTTLITRFKVHSDIYDAMLSNISQADFDDYDAPTPADPTIAVYATNDKPVMWCIVDIAQFYLLDTDNMVCDDYPLNTTAPTFEKESGGTHDSGCRIADPADKTNANGGTDQRAQCFDLSYSCPANIYVSTHDPDILPNWFYPESQEDVQHDYDLHIGTVDYPVTTVATKTDAQVRAMAAGGHGDSLLNSSAWFDASTNTNDVGLGRDGNGLFIIPAVEGLVNTQNIVYCKMSHVKGKSVEKEEVVQELVGAADSSLLVTWQNALQNTQIPPPIWKDWQSYPFAQIMTWENAPYFPKNYTFSWSGSALSIAKGGGNGKPLLGSEQQRRTGISDTVHVFNGFEPPVDVWASQNNPIKDEDGHGLPIRWHNVPTPNPFINTLYASDDLQSWADYCVDNGWGGLTGWQIISQMVQSNSGGHLEGSDENESNWYTSAKDRGHHFWWLGWWIYDDYISPYNSVPTHDSGDPHSWHLANQGWNLSYGIDGSEWWDYRRYRVSLCPEWLGQPSVNTHAGHPGKPYPGSEGLGGGSGDWNDDAQSWRTSWSHAPYQDKWKNHANKSAVWSEILSDAAITVNSDVKFYTNYAKLAHSNPTMDWFWIARDFGDMLPLKTDATRDRKDKINKATNTTAKYVAYTADTGNNTTTYDLQFHAHIKFEGWETVADIANLDSPLFLGGKVASTEPDGEQPRYNYNPSLFINPQDASVHCIFLRNGQLFHAENRADGREKDKDNNPHWSVAQAGTQPEGFVYAYGDAIYHEGIIVWIGRAEPLPFYRVNWVTSGDFKYPRIISPREDSGTVTGWYAQVGTLNSDGTWTWTDPLETPLHDGLPEGYNVDGIPVSDIAATFKITRSPSNQLRVAFPRPVENATEAMTPVLANIVHVSATGEIEWKQYA